MRAFRRCVLGDSLTVSQMGTDNGEMHQLWTNSNSFQIYVRVLTLRTQGCGLLCIQRPERGE